MQQNLEQKISENCLKKILEINENLKKGHYVKLFGN
jgi:hypothetical protein